MFEKKQTTVFPIVYTSYFHIFVQNSIGNCIALHCRALIVKKDDKTSIRVSIKHPDKKQ